MCSWDPIPVLLHKPASASSTNQDGHVDKEVANIVSGSINPGILRSKNEKPCNFTLNLSLVVYGILHKTGMESILSVKGWQGAA